MRFFQKIGDVDILPLLHAIQRQPELWNENNLRTTHPQSPHIQAEDIWLRFNQVKSNVTDAIDDTVCINYPAWYRLPQARQIIFDLMRRVEGEQLGRCLITKLSPGKQILPHEDGGAPAEWYDRYHVMLQNTPGSIFRCADEAVFMRPGEVWWFDNCKEHEVINNGSDDRITMIVDIRPCQ